MLYVIFRDGFDSLRQVILLAPIEALGIQSTFSSLFAFSHNGGTWFISCILICYLVYPLVQEILKQLTGKGKGILIGVCLGILLYSPIVVQNFNLMSTYSNPFFRVLEFILGAALASLKPEIDSRPFARHYLYRWSTVLFVTAGMLAGISAAVKAGFYTNDYMMYSWICLPCFMLAMLCLSGIESRQLEKSKGFAYCRSVSYAFFLAQLFSNDICKWLISRFSITHNLAVISLGWTVCILIAVGLHEIFEKPIAGVLRRKQIL